MQRSSGLPGHVMFSSRFSRFADRYGCSVRRAMASKWATPRSKLWLPTPSASKAMRFAARTAGRSSKKLARGGVAPKASPAVRTSVFGFAARSCWKYVLMTAAPPTLPTFGMESGSSCPCQSETLTIWRSTGGNVQASSACWATNARRRRKAVALTSRIRASSTRGSMRSSSEVPRVPSAPDRYRMMLRAAREFRRTSRSRKLSLAVLTSSRIAQASGLHSRTPNTSVAPSWMMLVPSVSSGTPADPVQAAATLANRTVDRSDIRAPPMERAAAARSTPRE